MVGLVGVEARVRVRARAGSERRSTSKVTSAVQEMFKRATRVKSQEMFKPRDVQAKRAICDSRIVFNSPTCPCPRAACRIRLSVWGGAPPMSRLAGLEFKFCDISSLLGRINLSIFIHV